MKITNPLNYKNYTIDFQTEFVSGNSSFWVYSKEQEIMGGFSTLQEAKKYIDSIA